MPVYQFVIFLDPGLGRQVVYSARAWLQPGTKCRSAFNAVQMGIAPQWRRTILLGKSNDLGHDSSRSRKPLNHTSQRQTVLDDQRLQPSQNGLCNVAAVARFLTLSLRTSRGHTMRGMLLVARLTARSSNFMSSCHFSRNGGPPGRFSTFLKRTLIEQMTGIMM